MATAISHGEEFRCWSSHEMRGDRFYYFAQVSGGRGITSPVSHVKRVNAASECRRNRWSETQQPCTGTPRTNNRASFVAQRYITRSQRHSGGNLEASDGSEDDRRNSSRPELMVRSLHFFPQGGETSGLWRGQSRCEFLAWVRYHLSSWPLYCAPCGVPARAIALFPFSSLQHLHCRTFQSFRNEIVPQFLHCQHAHSNMNTHNPHHYPH